MKLTELSHVSPMACGGCGHGLFRIAGTTSGPHIYVQCEKCDSISVIKPAPADLVVEWGPSGDGVLCRRKPMSPPG